MDSIAERVRVVRQRIEAAARRAGRNPDAVRLVAASKSQPVEAIAEAIAAGVSEFGENRAQELREKRPLIAQDVTWHFIGRLQTNKVKYVIPGVALIHSLDRLSLAEELQRRAVQLGVEVNALVEVNTSGETSKGGVSPADLPSFLAALSSFDRLRARGLMTMAAPGNPAAARTSFRRLRELRDALRAAPGGAELSELSMGMSDDFEIAVEEGATIVRIGSAIFGSRR